MKARPQRPSADVRGLMAELGDMVEDLGLETPTPATSGPAAPPSPPASAPAGSAAAPDAAEPVAAVPMWESADAEPAATLWQAFSPHLADSAPRPWTPEAAMAPLPPEAPPGARARTAARPARSLRSLRISLQPVRPHLFTVVTAVALAAAVAVVTFSRLDLGHTSGPAQPVTSVGFNVTGLRTVAAASPQQVRGAATVKTFLTTASQIYLDITYRQASPEDTLRVIILLQPGSGGPEQTVSDETHSHLDRGGEIALTVEAPTGGFLPGTYTVRALHDGHLDETWTFDVVAAGR
jgi:hypothetical protein